MQAMPQLVVLTGPIAAGKNTVAVALSADNSTVYCPRLTAEDRRHPVGLARLWHAPSHRNTDTGGHRGYGALWQCGSVNVAPTEGRGHE